MSTNTERRVYPRYLAVSFPILIDAPSLSDFQLFPVDISLGGYKVVVSECPVVGDLFDCSVEVKGKLFEECHGRVARVIENETAPLSWFVGMSLQPPEDQRIDYEETMNGIIEATWKKL